MYTDIIAQFHQIFILGWKKKSCRHAAIFETVEIFSTDLFSPQWIEDYRFMCTACQWVNFQTRVLNNSLDGANVLTQWETGLTEIRFTHDRLIDVTYMVQKRGKTISRGFPQWTLFPDGKTKWLNNHRDICSIFPQIDWVLWFQIFKCCKNICLIKLLLTVSLRYFKVLNEYTEFLLI